MGSGSSVSAQTRNLASTGGGGDGGGNDNGEQQKVDSRLPYPNFRELFTLKNYWKTVRRNERDCAKIMLAKYLKQNPENKEKYPKLKNIDVDTVSAATADSGFETVAANYLKVFDDVITTVEEKPADVSDACSRLTSVGKMHRSKVD
uniref:Globin family profile domain-containing protein n=1 Tax=Setaria digitata TaxID=48799 RepID=A0A915PMJ8_9BILA